MQTQPKADREAGFEPSLALLKVLADATRLRLVWALARQELPVSRLAELAGAQVAAVSQHLARLREAGVVTSRRDGTRIFYRLASDQVARLLEEIVVTTTRLEAASDGEETGPEGQAAVVPATRRVPGVAPRLAR